MTIKNQFFYSEKLDTMNSLKYHTEICSLSDKS